MKVTYDTAKDATNKRKHGVSLADAAAIDWDAALVWQDTRKEYGEIRMVALAPIGERLYFVAYIERNADLRIISLRKANKREFNYYEKEISSPH